MDELTIPATLSPMNNIPSTSFGPNQPSIGAEQFGPSSDLATNVPPETPSDQARPLHLDVDSSSCLDFQTLAGQSPPSVENVIIDTEGSKAEWRQPTVTSKSDDDSDDAGPAAAQQAGARAEMVSIGRALVQLRAML